MAPEIKVKSVIPQKTPEKEGQASTPHLDEKGKIVQSNVEESRSYESIYISPSRFSDRRLREPL